MGSNRTVSNFLLLMLIIIVVSQFPIILRDTYMRLTATKQQPHLGTGRKGRRTSIKKERQVYIVCVVVYKFTTIYVDLYTVVYLCRRAVDQNQTWQLTAKHGSLNNWKQQKCIWIFTYFDNKCDVSVSHKSEGHVHEAHGHKTTSSGHGEKREETGISSMCSGV